MASPARRKAVAARRAAEDHTTEAAVDEAPEEATEEEEDRTMEGALDRWSDVTAKEWAAFGVGATTSLLRGLQAVQEAQLEAAREVRQMHERVASELGSVRDFGDLARLQMSLVQSDGQVALASLSKIGALASQQMVDVLNDATASWVQLNSSTWSAALQWLDGMARPHDAEIVQAEVEHVVNPLTASPFVWPAQEVARQAMTLASSAWNDWLTWSGQMAEAGRHAVENAGTSR